MRSEARGPFFAPKSPGLVIQFLPLHIMASLNPKHEDPSQDPDEVDLEDICTEEQLQEAIRLASPAIAKRAEVALAEGTLGTEATKKFLDAIRNAKG